MSLLFLVLSEVNWGGKQELHEDDGSTRERSVNQAHVR